MEAVDILGDEREYRSTAFKFYKREVAGIGMNPGDQRASPPIPFPDELGIFRKGLRRGEIFRPKVAPEAARAAKGRDAAFSRYPGTG